MTLKFTNTQLENFIFIGTVYLSEKGVNTLVIKNENSLGIPMTHDIDLPTHIHELKLLGRYKVINIKCSLSIELLTIQFNTNIIISNSSTVHINRIITSNSQRSFLRIEIKANSSLYIGSDIILNELQLRGYFEVNRVTISRSGQVKIYNGATFNVNEIFLHSHANLTVDNGTKIGNTHLNFYLKYLQLGTSSFLFLNNSNARLDIDTFILKSLSIVSIITKMKYLYVESNFLTIEYFARFDCSYGGFDFIGNNKIQHNNSITLADNYGSGTFSSPGGGVIKLIVQQELVLDGDISVEGMNGGSIHIETDTMRGDGSLLAQGNNVGSGGSISLVIHSADFSLFRGTVYSRGGVSPIGNGSSGVFYLDHFSMGIRTRIIRIHNEGIPTNEVTLILMPSFETLLEIKGESLVSLSGKDVFEFNRIYGDGTATLRIQSGQTIILAKSFGISVPFAIPFRVEITEFGKIHLPARVMIDVKGNSNRPSFLIDGGLIDAGEFTIARGAYVKIKKNVYNQRSSGEISAKGHLTLRSIYLYSHLEINKDSSSRFIFTIKKAMILYTDSILSTYNLKIIAKDVIISYGSEINANIVNSDILPNIDAFNPIKTNFGAPGNDSNLIGGGGIIILNAHSLYLDGKISAVGGSSNINAGSGGAVAITVNKINGLGIIDVSGGKGGGAGGSIYIDSKVYVRYLTLTTNGGAFLDEREFAKTGWSYIKDFKKGFPYTRFILNNIGVSGSHQSNISIDSFKLLLDEMIIGNNVNLRLYGKGNKM